MKVAVYTHSLPPEIDGVSRRFTGILNELHRQGHETMAFTLEKEVEEVRGCKFVHLDHCFVAIYPEKRLGAPSWRNFLSIYTALREERPDVVHCVSDATTVLFALAGKLLSIPVVVSIHTDVFTLLQKIGFSKIAGLTSCKDRFECALVDGVATTSSSFLSNLHKRGINATHVIKTAVDMTVFHPSCRDADLREKLTFGNPNGLLCVFVGRLSPEKNIDALAKWVTAVPNTYLAIVGDGPSSSELAKLHSEENRVYCIPEFVRGPQVAKVMASADVHVSASEFETLGNTVLEAFSCGTPVVVPRASGFVDTVISGSDGYLYDPKNVEEASDRIQELMMDPSLRRELGESARRKTVENTIERVVEDLLVWYEDSQRCRAQKSSVWVLFSAALSLVSCLLLVTMCKLYYGLEYVVLKWKGLSAPEQMHSLRVGLSTEKEEDTPLTSYVHLYL